MKLLALCGGTMLGRAILRRTFAISHPLLEREVFGIRFHNPVGIAAGFDRDMKHYRQLSAMGFGFVEGGTITPRPQPGSLKPRIFRLPKDGALINRVGFRNRGMDNALDNLRRRGNRRYVIVGANIAKNTLTQSTMASNDYLRLFRNLYQYVDYFVVNVSTPTVANLAQVQNKESIESILNPLLDFRRGQSQYRPLLLKVSPDWSRQQIDDVIGILIDTQLDGLVVAGASSSREGLTTDAQTLNRIGNGGLSGRPLFEKNLELIRYVAAQTHGRYPIIGSGGILSPEDAAAMLDAGASLIEIYTGLVYNGPKFVKNICKHLITHQMQARPQADAPIDQQVDSEPQPTAEATES